MSSFVSMYGGNKDTMRHSGMKGLNAALAAGLTINQIRDQTRREGVTFGVRAREFLEARPSNLFISQFGGNEDTMANSGMNAVSKALAAGLSPEEIDSRAASEGVSFGVNARNFLNQQAVQKAEAAEMRSRFEAQMKSIQDQLASQQKEYQANLAQMTNTLNASMNPETRQNVLGVKGAGNASQRASRRGVKANFARTGLRIKSLNI